MPLIAGVPALSMARPTLSSAAACWASVRVGVTTADATKVKPPPLAAVAVHPTCGWGDTFVTSVGFRSATNWSANGTAG
ncbi:MAG: hypothetical protein ACREFY_05285 [Acetobacteraceae bacterium]